MWQEKVSHLEPTDEVSLGQKEEIDIYIRIGTENSNILKSKIPHRHHKSYT